MKQLYKFTLAAMFSCGLLISCGTSEEQPSEATPSQHDIVEANAEAYLQDKLDDPSSYEFVSLELMDSVLYKDNIEYRRKQFAGRDQDLKTQAILIKIDSIETGLGEKSNEVASYTYLFKFRNNNGFGAKVLNERIIQTTPAPELGIVNMASDRDGLFLNPNDFPGYLEMVSKNL